MPAKTEPIPTKDEAQTELVEVETQAELPEQRGTLRTQGQQLLSLLFSAINDVDLDAARARVNRLRAQHPHDSDDAFIQRLVVNKSTKTSSIGAVASSAGLIPGLGTATAMTVGVAADIGATFKQQAELVAEIAVAHDYPLTEQEKQRVVLLVSGLNTGTSALATEATKNVSLRLTEQVTEKSLLNGIPIIGVIASASTNAMATYVIGQRADVYFRHGPEAVGSWADSLRAISGVDERRVASWMSQTGEMVKSGAGQASTALQAGASQIGDGVKVGTRQLSDAGQSAGQAIMDGMSRYYDKLVGRNRPQPDSQQEPGE